MLEQNVDLSAVTVAAVDKDDDDLFRSRTCSLVRHILFLATLDVKTLLQTERAPLQLNTRPLANLDRECA